LRRVKLLLTILPFCANLCLAQDSSKLNKILSLPDKVFGVLDKRTATLEEKLDRQTNKYLDKLQKQEFKLKKKLFRKDSVLTQQLFGDIDKKYAELKNGSVPGEGNMYSGHADSLTTALKFLQSESLSKNREVENLLNRYSNLERKFYSSEEVRRFLLHRQQYLKEQFVQLGMVRELKQFRKDVYYYQQQINEYKESFESPSQLENKLIGFAQKFPQFRKFFEKNSIAGNFFSSSTGTNVSLVSYTGVQTRYAVQQTIASRLSGDPAQFVQTQLRSVNSRAGGEKQNLGLPTLKKGSKNLGFKPNSQKTKSFRNRVEKGANLHFGKLNNYFPAGADLGLTLGYRLNDNSVVGIGTSYKMGLGNSFNAIHFSGQGYSLRSYLDWKIKGSLYAYGGYEKLYLPTLSRLNTSLNQWQESGLLGLSKKYTFRGKLDGNMQFLFDFLSYKSIPRREPVVFRIGYNF
jgi:hypothetical protein